MRGCVDSVIACVAKNQSQPGRGAITSLSSLRSRNKPATASKKNVPAKLMKVKMAPDHRAYQ